MRHGIKSLNNFMQSTTDQFRARAWTTVRAGASPFVPRAEGHANEGSSAIRRVKRLTRGSLFRAARSRLMRSFSVDCYPVFKGVMSCTAVGLEGSLWRRMPSATRTPSTESRSPITSKSGGSVPSGTFNVSSDHINSDREVGKMGQEILPLDRNKVGISSKDELTPQVRQFSLRPLSNDHSILRLCFEEAVSNLVESRKEKELLLRLPTRGRKSVLKKQERLDYLDQVEKDACSRCYGIFCYNTFVSDEPTDRSFDKNLADEVVERRFGSLENDLREFDSADEIEDASSTFSCYLARKVWSPVPWRKFEGSLDSFYQRVAFNPILRDPCQEAIQLSVAILRAITCGEDATPFRSLQPVPESGCFEVPKEFGGKRNALYVPVEEDNPGVRRAAYLSELVGFIGTQPRAIYTGGKIRVITTSTALTAKYLWVNKFLGACFRKLPLSVFGGRVDRWFDRVKETMSVLGEDEDYISGDLESATDLFDGRITDVLLETFAREYGLTEDDVKNIQSFTTQSRLLQIGPEAREVFIPQTRGQLMGSEVSFPFLCILSLTAYLFTRSETWRRKFVQARPKRAKAMLHGLKRVGINGDDIVFAGNRAERGRWVDGVEAIGGKVSRGKTLVNKFFFTVNSELWCSNGKIPCSRPSFLTAMSDGRKYFLNPDVEWDEYRRYQSIRDHNIFNIVERLKLDIPKRWGGLGLVHSFNPYRCALYKCIAEAHRAASRRSKWCGTRRAFEELDNIKASLKAHGKKVLVVASREMKKAYGKIRETEHALWSIPADISDEEKANIPSVARYIAQGSVSKDQLYSEYKKLMKIPRDRVLFELPIGLLRVFGATLWDPSDRVYRNCDYGDHCGGTEFVLTEVKGIPFNESEVSSAHYNLPGSFTSALEANPLFT